MGIKTTLAATALALAASPAFATTELLTFEEFADGDLITTVGNATFTTNGATEVYDFGGSYAQSGVNTIAPDASGGSFNGDLYVDFFEAVSDLSFWSGGDDTAGTQATINVFVGGLFDTAVALSGDGDATTTEFHDLSAFVDVTRIEVVNVVDDFGLVYDDFSYSYAVDVVPLPASGVLLLSGLAAVGFGRRRRRG
ncbi:hypothetical protein Ga0609869_002202 [Rhodovulum iodosum]|uniref:VPLPA-CTERM sorting domain-containing protein n=1 Tax=Rhodovulum iodosum TaxID=68291 RepID=A0ABV3XU40_9RHOB|nr:VPLPA-CTERM sorting domain-containing protein [Rhodovulum robiginosum]RSK32277.1 VPLPA-CTERM sorting domain-containing protein [Rhodovulum robiginosum]